MIGGINLKQELKNKTSADLMPQTTVNQYGEKSVHIGRVDSMSQNVFFVPYNAATPKWNNATDK